ncbi:hypothetical protein [Maribacter algarum]|nr:hypothetical protein [Maribacter algarum]
MKKIMFAFVLLVSVVVMSSCDYDDSNDIDVLNPIDSTVTGKVKTL